MTNVYDLIINLNDYDYKFYEWEESDEIEYLKKSILLKVSDYIYKRILSNNIVLGDKILELIKDKSCVLKNKRIENITYMAIFTNSKDVIGVTFSSNGNILEKTRFTIQDELELLEMSYSLKYTKIDYKELLNKDYKISFISRKDKENMKYILSELNKIKNESSKIEYLYYEWFNKKNMSDNAYEKLVSDIKENYNENKCDFLKLLNLVNIKNNV